MKKGFVFIETIVTVVILCAALIYLYSSYSSILNNEEERIYYDDTAYIYRTYYIRKFLLNHSTIQDIKLYGFKNIYVELISYIDANDGYEGLFKNEVDKKNFASIFSDFHVLHLYLISQKMIDECDGSDNDTEICKNSYQVLSFNARNYVKSLNDTDHDYILVVEYAETLNEIDGTIISCVWGTDINCHSYFTSLGV